MPDDRRKVIEAQLSAVLLNGRVQRHYRMAAIILSSRQANISHHANQAPAGDQSSKTVGPDPVKFLKELIVIFDMTELRFRVSIFLQRPVGRRSQYQVNALRLEVGHLPSVAQEQAMRGRNGADRLLDGSYRLPVLRQSRNSPLCIAQMPQFTRNEGGEVNGNAFGRVLSLFSPGR